VPRTWRARSRADERASPEIVTDDVATDDDDVVTDDVATDDGDVVTDDEVMTDDLVPLRLLSWNVQHLFGDPLAVRRVLRAAAPDLVCLQEAPRVPWSASWLRSLASSTGLIYVAGGWASAATAILRSARVQVRDPEAFAFPSVPLRGRRLPRRGATLVSVAPPDRSGPLLRVASVHLGVSAPERLDHVEQLVERLTAARLPVVVAGDLNEQPNGPAWQAFSAIVTDPAPEAPMTFSTRRPRRRIDAVLTGPQVETVEYGQWSPDRRDAELASDHLPVLSLIRYRA
jgi:endonuclease/exonuclease/phosphatase family metal-dependent hydrolase